MTLALYLLPPSGPSALDLLLMSLLAKHTTVTPVLSVAGAGSDDAALRRTRELLDKPSALVPGLQSAVLWLGCVGRSCAPTWHLVAAYHR